MWLKRLLKISATGPAGGGGGDLGVAGDNVMNVGGVGQGALFADPPNREEVLYNAKKRRQKRKMLERKRKWRSLRDQP